jgi:hypothetical protein
MRRGVVRVRTSSAGARRERPRKGIAGRSGRRTDCRIFETADGATCACEALSQGRCPRYVSGDWVDGCPPTRFVEPSSHWTCFDDGAGCLCQASNVPQLDGGCSQSGCCALLSVEARGGFLPGHRCVCTDDPANSCRLHSDYFAIPVAACPPPEPPQLPRELVAGWYCAPSGSDDCRCMTAREGFTAPCPDKPACCRLSDDGQSCTCTAGKSCPESGVTRCPPT